MGHLICSSCHGKLQKHKKCHHCSRESNYNRCHGVEKIIESIQVPCSNTKYGCSVKTSYYERAGHETKCQYAPCFCPDTGCSFSASTGLLQEHFTTEHQWPSSKCRYGWCFYADVKEVHVISSEDEQLAVSSRCSMCSLMILSRNSAVLFPSASGSTIRTTPSLPNSMCQARHFLTVYQGIITCSFCPGSI